MNVTGFDYIPFESEHMQSLPVSKLMRIGNTAQ